MTLDSREWVGSLQFYEIFVIRTLNLSTGFCQTLFPLRLKDLQLSYLPTKEFICLKFDQAAAFQLST